MSPYAEVERFLAEVAAPTPAATGGGVSAVTIAAAAGLVAMCVRVSGSAQLPEEDGLAEDADRKRERAMVLAESDGDSYAAVFEAQRRGRDDPDRADAIRRAFVGAAQPPLQLARLAAEVAASAEKVAGNAKPALRGDLITAASLAAAAARSCATLVRINLTAANAGLDDAADAEAAAATAERTAEACLATVSG